MLDATTLPPVTRGAVYRAAAHRLVAAGRVVKVTAIDGEWCRLAVRLRPGRLVNRIVPVADVAAWEPLPRSAWAADGREV